MHPEFEIESVKEKFTILFGVNLSEVTPLFERKCMFQRTGLNKYTADQYVAKLTKIGCLCYLEQELDGFPVMEPIIEEPSTKEFNTTIPDKSDKNLCPKCQSSNINHEQCLDCGMIFEKYRKLTSISKSGTFVTKDVQSEDNIDTLEHMKRAVRIIKYVTIYLLIVFTADNYIQDNKQTIRLLLDRDFEIGIFPYIIGHIGLVFGCYFLALAKGRSGLWGLLSLASLPGLGVLLLLPNKNVNTLVRPVNKTKIFAIAMILISVYWALANYNKSIEESKFIDSSVVLREQRHEYPIATFDIDSELYKSELNELDEFLDKGFVLLSENDYRSSQVAEIANTMFSETTRLFIWMNYQQYLQYRNGEHGSDYLEQKNITKLQTAVFKKIKNAIETLGSAELFKVYEDWFLGTNIRGEKYELFEKFNKELFDTKGFFIRLPIVDDDALSPPEFSFENIQLPKFSNVKLSINGDILLFNFSDYRLPAVNKMLAIAFYYRTYKRYSLKERKQVDRYFLVQVQISPDFPNKYLHSEFSVFKSVDIFPLMAR